MNNYNFINPEFLYLLAIPLAYIIWLSLRKRNLSSEIIKLNELLKSGILTQEEFDKAKKKLLDN